MQQSEIILYGIKLVLGGVTAFLAILLWSKTRDPAWMSLVAGAITSYSGIVFTMMVDLGIISPGTVTFCSVPVVLLFFTIVPAFFFIIAFILMLIRSR